MDTTAHLPVARPPTVRARHAASLLIVRQEPDGAAILMGTRGAGHRFMPNRLVFPGGGVEPADLRAKPAHPLRTETEAALRRGAGAKLAAGLATAVARELEEETGLTLGTPPRLDRLHYLCRAVTPPGQPIRFNARFLVVEDEAVSGSLGGSGELENLRYYSMSQALELDLAWVTRKVLENLQAWLGLTAEERVARSEFPVCRSKKWRLE